MPLIPKEVDFNETWMKIKKTMNSVIMLGQASNSKAMEQKRADWNDRFKYPPTYDFTVIESKMLT